MSDASTSIPGSLTASSKTIKSKNRLPRSNRTVMKFMEQTTLGAYGKRMRRAVLRHHLSLIQLLLEPKRHLIRQNGAIGAASGKAKLPVA